MSATLVSSNTTIKVNGAISAGNAVGAISGTLYTAPSNGYGIVNFRSNGSANITSLTIAGRTFTNSLTGTQILYALYVGPSQSLSWTSSTGLSANTVEVFGVEFINTP